MGVKANKRRGHRAEAEAGGRASSWPAPFAMVRTGLDGGHDLRGPSCHGEVKAVKAGPAWLKDGLRQMDASPGRAVLVVRLSRGPGAPVRWLVVQDLAQFEETIGFEHESGEADTPGDRQA